MKGSFWLPCLIELHVRERGIADNRIDGRKTTLLKWLDTDVLAGMERAGDPAGKSVFLDADEPHALRGVAHEIAGAAARLQHGGIGRHAEPLHGVVHGRMTMGDV